MDVAEPLLAHVLHAPGVPTDSFSSIRSSPSPSWSWWCGRCSDDCPERLARTAIVFAVLPVSWMGFYGVGPDGLTLLLLAVALVGARAGGSWSCGLLLGFQHAELASRGRCGVLADLSPAGGWHDVDDRLAVRPALA